MKILTVQIPFFSESIKGATAHIFPDGKHNLHLKDASTLNKIVHDFLTT
jgi:pimeloyl-ACP methyl ester carboxylesterase